MLTGVIFNDFIFSTPLDNEFKTAMREISKEYNFPLIDHAQVWDCERNAPTAEYFDLLCPDLIHPTNEGHKAIARAITNAIGLPYKKQSRPTKEDAPFYLSSAFPDFIITPDGYAELTVELRKNSMLVSGGMQNKHTGIIGVGTTLFRLPGSIRGDSLQTFVTDSGKTGAIKVTGNNVTLASSVDANAVFFVNFEIFNDELKWI